MAVMTAETAKYQMKDEIGCGFTNAFFAFRSFKAVLFQSNPDSQNQINSSKSAKHEKPPPVKLVPVIKPRNSECREKRISDATRTSSTSSSKTSGSKIPAPTVNLSHTKRLNKEPTFHSSYFSLTLTGQRKFDANGTLFRASAGNVMLLGHLGNLKRGKGSKNDEKDVKKNIIADKPVEKKTRFWEYISEGRHEIKMKNAS